MIKNNLGNVTNSKPQENSRFDLKYFPQSDILANSLNEMFPGQIHEDITVKKAKEILGEKFTTEEVKATIASFEYLINAWLQQYEKKVFDNKTLKELLEDL